MKLKFSFFTSGSIKNHRHLRRNTIYSAQYQCTMNPRRNSDKQTTNSTLNLTLCCYFHLAYQKKISKLLTNRTSKWHHKFHNKSKYYSYLINILIINNKNTEAYCFKNKYTNYTAYGVKIKHKILNQSPTHWYHQLLHTRNYVVIPPQDTPWQKIQNC